MKLTRAQQFALHHLTNGCSLHWPVPHGVGRPYLIHPPGIGSQGGGSWDSVETPVGLALTHQEVCGLLDNRLIKIDLDGGYCTSYIVTPAGHEEALGNE